MSRHGEAMTGLVDFLLARIAEDEAVAHAAIRTAERGGTGRWYWSNAGEAVFLSDTETPVLWGDEQSRPAGNHVVRHDPARVLAECEAKRRIVELVADPATSARTGPLGAVVPLLALPYADHEAYDDAWREGESRITTA